ncbi:MAG: SDR family oxidoreductase [Starkeya sp.]|nr:SDR family oxidoreductase [Starkeya sp.]
MFDLTGKTALVTGATGGIGGAIAKALHAQGATVALSGTRREVLEALAAEMGERTHVLPCDLSNIEQVEQLVPQAEEAMGELDILVNNAGIARQGPVAEISLADLDALLNVNVRAVVLASQAAIPHLKAGGRIISIGSCLGERVPFGGVTVYSMTKSALLSFTRGLARELGPADITVNVVQPGATDTDMNPAHGEQADGMRALTPLGRYGSPADIAAAVAFLASPAARQISGTALTVDGGFNA